jgi:hypothetical protein
VRAVIAWWDLSASDQTVDSLRDHLRGGGVAPWADVPGLRLKFWISDRAGNRWGAVMLWEPGHPAGGQPLPRHRAAELIGYPPTERVCFDVEATVEGRYAVAALAGLGLALEGT